MSNLTLLLATFVALNSKSLAVKFIIFMAVLLKNLKIA